MTSYLRQQSFSLNSSIRRGDVMIKNSWMLEQHKKDFFRKDTPDFFRNLSIYDALYEEARELGIFPLKNPMEGLERKIFIAKVLNVSRTA